MDNMNKKNNGQKQTSGWEKIKPCEVMLEAGERGLYCRMSFRNEGVWAGSLWGEYFFPDKSCSGLTAGPAIVTELKHYGNYGFFKGHMNHFTAPTEEQLAEYILVNSYENTTIRFMDGPFGTYIALVFTHPDVPRVERVALTKDGKPLMLGALFEANDIIDGVSTVTEEISAMDFLCQGYQGCTVNELMDKFVPCRYEIPWNAKSSPKESSKEFSEAVRNGFLEIFRVKNVDMAVVHRKFVLWAILNLSREEMDKLIHNVNCVNLGEK